MKQIELMIPTIRWYKFLAIVEDTVVDDVINVRGRELYQRLEPYIDSENGIDEDRIYDDVGATAIVDISDID
jgi:hypothetical protein